MSGLAYAIAATDLDKVAADLSEAFQIALQQRESSYRGGDYWLYRGGDGEEVILQLNHEDDGEPMEPNTGDYGLLLYISTSRPEHFERALESVAVRTMLLRRRAGV